jgi:thiamine kinase-like enzyme
MKKVEKLFDENFIFDLFRKNVLPLYSDFVEIKKIDIQPYKKNIWDDAYHVVVGYDTTFVNQEGEEETLPIFCSAHSDEPRKNVFTSLQYLWEQGFSEGNLSIPHPLFFDKYFNGTFYRGAEGKNLYRYIRVSDFSEIESIIPKAAAWFSKLHALPTDKALNFNEMNSRIKTVIPGSDHILERVARDYPQHSAFFNHLYKIFIDKEEEFLSKNSKRWLVHGDAHPENVIRMSPEKIAVIDFTDLCLTDYARDLGTFLQQVEYMCDRKISDKNYSKKIKKIFLDEYFKHSSEKYSLEVQARIDNYYYWTAIRTATFFLLKYDPEPARAELLIQKVKEDLQIN